MPTFSPQRFRAQRAAANLTREQVAVQTGLSYQTVYATERGAIKPSVTSIGKYADVLGCSVSDFFDDDAVLIRGR